MSLRAPCILLQLVGFAFWLPVPHPGYPNLAPLSVPCSSHWLYTLPTCSSLGPPTPCCSHSCLTLATGSVLWLLLSHLSCPCRITTTHPCSSCPHHMTTTCTPLLHVATCTLIFDSSQLPTCPGSCSASAGAPRPPHLQISRSDSEACLCTAVFLSFLLASLLLPLGVHLH